uniref:Uncharacterized protein n=1 Tax=Rhizophora mucronata TaxID=61149 RepID=A0A2P2QT50_RHIMU
MYYHFYLLLTYISS